MSLSLKQAQPNSKAGRALRRRAPQAIENVKKAICLRGPKTSEIIVSVLRDFAMLKKPDGKMFTRKNDVRPFEDESRLEFLCERNDASLFAYGSHSKKRPHNLVLGRMFDWQLTDMLELGVGRYVSVADRAAPSKKLIGSKPCFVFTGNEFQSSLVHIKLKSLLLDFFRGRALEAVDLTALDHVICVTATGPTGPVKFRTYVLDFVDKEDGEGRLIHEKAS